MAENMTNLPPEYMAQLAAVDRQRKLAQLLQTQAMGFKGAQSQGPVAAKTSPLAWLANAAAGSLGTEIDSRGIKSAGDIVANAGVERQTELDNLLKAPEAEQFGMGARAKFSQNQAIAKALQAQVKDRQDRKDKRIDAFGTIVKDTNPQAGANAILSGQLPQGSYQTPNIPEPEFNTTPAGQQYVRTQNRKGESEVKFPPKGINITNQMPGNEGKFSLDVLEAELKPRQLGAESAKNVYSATTRAVDALTRGAKAGGGESIKQGIRKAAQAFNINLPATAETNELSMALGNALLAEASKIKPISNNDIETLKGIVGSIDSDPTALSRALAFSQALSLRGLSEYSRFIDEQGKTLTGELPRQRLAGSKVGYELPPQLTGPAAFQMEVLRNYQLGGGDISGFGEPGTGKPFAQDTQFNTNPAGAFPGVAPKPKPAPSNNLTPDEQTELSRLRSKYGR